MYNGLTLMKKEETRVSGLTETSHSESITVKIRVIPVEKTVEYIKKV